MGIPFESPHSMTSLVLDQPESTQARDLAVERKLFKIRLAATDGLRNSASLLINRMYSWRGYETGHTLDERPNIITLMASAEGATIGTITLNFDGPAGLPADEVYGDQLDVLRNNGHRLCEPTKLAIDQDIRSKRVIATLFNISYIYACNILRFSDFVLEVNPRHAVFYQRMLGSHVVGEQRNCPRVNAPAVLLKLDIAHMTSQIEKFGGKLDHAAGEKSLYPYFFSKKDEAGITERLIGSPT